jgi:hypothetical protein
MDPPVLSSKWRHGGAHMASVWSSERFETGCAVSAPAALRSHSRYRLQWMKRRPSSAAWQPILTVFGLIAVEQAYAKALSELVGKHSDIDLGARKGSFPGFRTGGRRVAARFRH